MITWRPIAELPDELKDGREVLLWEGDTADIGQFGSNDEWMIGLDVAVEPTHFAEINAPCVAHFTAGGLITGPHDLTLEPQSIADQWMGKCSCGWRSAISFYEIPERDALLAEIRQRHADHVAPSDPSKPTA